MSIGTLRFVNSDVDAELPMVDDVSNVYNAAIDASIRKILVVGKVQSGKTSNMIELTKKLFDNQEKDKVNLVILLTGTKNNLNNQTFDRFKSSYDGLNANLFDFSNKESISKFIDSPIQGFNIVIALKNRNKLETIINKIEKASLISNYTVIIDDEADHASLNTLNYKNTDQESITYRKIAELIDSGSPGGNKVTYIGYTATPQGLLLGGKTNKLFPEKIIYIQPHEGYFGVEQFLESEHNIYEIIEDRDQFTEQGYISSDLKKALTYYANFIQSGIEGIAFDPDYGVNMVIHNSQLKTNHKITQKEIDSFLSNNFPGFKPQIIMLNGINRDNKDIFLNPEKKNLNYIIIGGELLSRGYTIPNLLVFYSAKTSQKYNLDTVYQRMRFCGYRNNYSEHMKIYITQEMYDYYGEIRKNDKMIEETIKSDNKSFGHKIDSNVWFISSIPELFPTKKNVISYYTKDTTNSGDNLVVCLYTHDNGISEDTTKLCNFFDGYDEIASEEYRDTNGNKYNLYREKDLERFFQMFTTLNIDIESQAKIGTFEKILKYVGIGDGDSIHSDVFLFVHSNCLDENYAKGDNYRSIKNNSITFIGDSERSALVKNGIGKKEMVILLKRLTLNYDDTIKKESLVVDFRLPEGMVLLNYET